MMDEHRRIRGGMLLLTVLGALLMLPPLVAVFNQDISHFGMPQIVFFLFALWIVLIAGTALMAHAMPRDDGTGEGDD